MCHKYNNELLVLAEDLGKKLLPAFNTKTGIPEHRVNLKTGKISLETPNTCIAAAGTLILEFGTLSILTNNYTYYNVSKRVLLIYFIRQC